MGMGDMIKQGIILYTAGMLGGTMGAVGSAYVTTGIVGQKFKQDYAPRIAMLGEDYNHDGQYDLLLQTGDFQEVPLYTFIDEKNDDVYFLPKSTLLEMQEADKLPSWVSEESLESILELE